MKPAALGPKAGAKAITMPNSPLAKPRLSGGKVSMMTVMTMGMRMPAPAACSRRPHKSTKKLGPQPARALPPAKMSMDTMKSPRVE